MSLFHCVRSTTSKKFFPLIIATLLLNAAPNLMAAPIILSGTSYTENFDSIGTALPTNGVTIFTGATASSNGTAATLTTAQTQWSSSTGAFANYASSTGLLSTDVAATQNASTDRSLALRQTGAVGDPGAAFVFSFADTLGFENFNFAIAAEMLSVQTRSTIWSIEYRLGATGNYNSLSTYTDPGVFGSTAISIPLPAAVNNQSQLLEIRIAALTASTGSGSRDTFGVDDLNLTFQAVSAVPEPSTIAFSAVAGLGLLGFRLRRKQG